MNLKNESQTCNIHAVMPDFRGKIPRKSGACDVRGHNLVPEGSQTSNNNNIAHAARSTLRIGCNPGHEDVSNNWSIVLKGMPRSCSVQHHCLVNTPPGWPNDKYYAYYGAVMRKQESPRWP